MAAVHSANVISTPMPLSLSDFTELGHIPNHSVSTTSGLTTSEAISGRQGGTSASNSQENSRRPRASDPGIYLPLQYPYHESTRGERTRPVRARLYTRLGLRVAVLCWVGYCTIRYFIAVQIYKGDNIRQQYALGMGIVSAFTIIFFASEIFMTSRSPDNQSYRRLRTIIPSLAYLSSVLVLGLTIINLVLVNVWRTPHDPSQFGRSIQGRCHWDLDVVWSGTGMVCPNGEEKPFGDWLSAAIVRLVVSIVITLAYHLTAHIYPANRDAQQTIVAAGANMGELVECQPSIAVIQPLLPTPYTYMAPVVITPSEDDYQRRSLSFTAAGQVLSRIEGSESGDDDHTSITTSSEQHQHLEDLTHSRGFNRDTSAPPSRSESPEQLSPAENLGASLDSGMLSYLPQLGLSLNPSPGSGELTPDPPPSTYLRNIIVPSNDLQDFALAFPNLTSHFPQEAADYLSPDTSTGPSRSAVRVLGSLISRMSTIDSVASREVACPMRSPSSPETNSFYGSGSKSQPGSDSSHS